MISHKPEHVFDSMSNDAQPRRSSDNRESHEERLAHILQAAMRIIAQVGYEKASMRQVAKAAGVSLAGMYHYFESKERMLFLIQFRTFNSLLNNLREKLHGVTAPDDQVQVMIRAHVAYFAANMTALKVCSHELDSLGGPAYDETRKIRRDYYDLTRSIIDNLLNIHPGSAAFDRHVATMSLFGTLNWLYRWYDPKRGPSPTVLANQIAKQFIHGVLCVQPDRPRLEPTPDAQMARPDGME